MTGRRAVVAILVGLAAIDALGPQITRHGPPKLAFLWLAIAVLLIAWLALALWHRRRLAELRERWLMGEDWEKVPPWTRDDFWACPRCGVICPSIAAASLHMTSEISPCAAYQAHLEQVTPQVKATIPGAGWPAGIAGDGLNDEKDQDQQGDHDGT